MTTASPVLFEPPFMNAFQRFVRSIYGAALSNGYIPGSSTNSGVTAATRLVDGTSVTYSISVGKTKPTSPVLYDLWLVDDQTSVFHNMLMVMQDTADGNWQPATELLVFGKPQTNQPGTRRLLGKLIGADFNVTTDNIIPINSNNWMLDSILVTNASVSLTTAAGGVYTAATKGGTVLVAAAQVYTQLSTATKGLLLTMAAGATQNLWTGANIYLNLTTAQGVAATADVYAFGYDIGT